MAVRHLKRYASWVQTVQEIKFCLLNSLNPFEFFVCEISIGTNHNHGGVM